MAYRMAAVIYCWIYRYGDNRMRPRPIPDSKPHCAGTPWQVRRRILAAKALGVAVGFLLGAALGAAPGLALASEAAARPVTVFAAASTANVINALVAAYGARGGGQVRPVFASSSTLARQISQGAPADLVISANAAWMDYLAERGLLEPGTRKDLFGNRLVLIVPGQTAERIEIKPGFALEALLGDGRLAMGDPGHVPAGLYARAALESLGVWKNVQGKLAHAPDVRAALALVERGEVPAGIVYATDAAISRKVTVAGLIPTETHPPIVYPAAVLAGRKDASVLGFYRFLGSAQALAIIRAQGFVAANAEG